MARTRCVVLVCVDAMRHFEVNIFASPYAHSDVASQGWKWLCSGQRVLEREALRRKNDVVCLHAWIRISLCSSCYG
jgi:hypothetical protein